MHVRLAVGRTRRIEGLHLDERALPKLGKVPEGRTRRRRIRLAYPDLPCRTRGVNVRWGCRAVDIDRFLYRLALLTGLRSLAGHGNPGRHPPHHHRGEDTPNLTLHLTP